MEEVKEKEALIEELADVFPQVITFSPDSYVVKDLKSKRNEVFEVEAKKKVEGYPQTFIVKRFLADTADNEVHNLRHISSQNLAVPSILQYKNPYLLLEKIAGENMCDYINLRLKNANKLSELKANTRKELKKSVKLVANWFAKLHKNNVYDFGTSDQCIVLNKGDIRLRDFIINPTVNRVYGVDFETAYKGDYLEDISGICCSLIDTNPGIFELSEPHHKITLINVFLKEYHNINKDFISAFNFITFSKLLIKQLNKVKKRRGMGSFNINGERILNKIYSPMD